MYNKISLLKLYHTTSLIQTYKKSITTDQQGNCEQLSWHEKSNL